MARLGKVYLLCLLKRESTETISKEVARHTSRVEQEKSSVTKTVRKAIDTKSLLVSNSGCYLLGWLLLPTHHRLLRYAPHVPLRVLHVSRRRAKSDM